MNSITATIRMSEDIKKELDEIAREENRSFNNLIVTILIRYLENKHKDQK